MGNLTNMTSDVTKTVETMEKNKNGTIGVIAGGVIAVALLAIKIIGSNSK